VEDPRRRARRTFAPALTQEPARTPSRIAPAPIQSPQGGAEEAWRNLRENPVSDAIGGFVPGVGQIMSAEDLASAISERRPGIAALAAVGLIPVAGGLAKAASMLRAGRAARNLPMDEASRIARARELGFDVDNPMYHGTAADIGKFERSSWGATGPGVYLTNSPEEAAMYARRAVSPRDLTGPNVMPVFVRRQNVLSGRVVEGADPQTISETARRQGYNAISQTVRNPASGVQDKVEYLNVLNPKDIRSVYARFDPARRRSSDLLAGLALPAIFTGGAVANQRRKRED